MPCGPLRHLRALPAARCGTARPARSETPGPANRSRSQPAACRSSHPRDSFVANWREGTALPWPEEPRRRVTDHSLPTGARSSQYSCGRGLSLPGMTRTSVERTAHGFGGFSQSPAGCPPPHWQRSPPTLGQRGTSMNTMDTWEISYRLTCSKTALHRYGHGDAEPAVQLECRRLASAREHVEEADAAR